MVEKGVIPCSRGPGRHRKKALPLIEGTRSPSQKRKLHFESRKLTTVILNTWLVHKADLQAEPLPGLPFGLRQPRRPVHERKRRQ